MPPPPPPPGLDFPLGLAYLHNGIYAEISSARLACFEGGGYVGFALSCQTHYLYINIFATMFKTLGSCIYLTVEYIYG
jgi:hypothetical protein